MRASEAYEWEYGTSRWQGCHLPAHMAMERVVRHEWGVLNTMANQHGAAHLMADVPEVGPR